MFHPPADPPPPVAKWFEAYQSAVLEPDYAKLPIRIAEARNAIFHRAEEIITDSADNERRLLKDALYVLDVLAGIAAKNRAAA